MLIKEPWSLEMSDLALPKIQQMQPYRPPTAGRNDFDGLLLDFNERYVDPNFLKSVIKDTLLSGKIHLYPEYSGLEQMIAEYAGVKAGEIIVTSGSDQAIELIFRTFSETGSEVIIPSPSFSMFDQIAGSVGCKTIKPGYATDDLAFPLESVLESISSKTRIIIICNPNNPTGTIVDLADIEKIAEKASRSVVLIDEAYFEFSGVSAVGLIKKYPNILITRTFSKAFGLAGLRVGYVIATKNNVSQLRKVCGPYNVNIVAVAAARQALLNKNEMLGYAREVVAEAKPFVEDFFRKNNIKFYRSAGNFILVKPEKPEQVYENLKQNGILIRPRTESGIEGTVRVTITTLEQMKQFCEIYEKVAIR
jgi:histidinol-phosphate aminotransferase